MKRVLTAVILVPLVILALFRAPLWLFTLLVMGVALLAAREYFDIAERTGFRPMRGLGYSLLLGVFILSFAVSLIIGAESSQRSPDDVIQFIAGLPFLLVLLPIVFLLISLGRKSLVHSLGDAAVSFIAIPYLGFTLLVLPFVRAMQDGALYLLFLMLLVWCGDVAAYYVGRAIGKHKLAPRISPGKTWEGAIASVVGAVMVGLLLFHYINPIANAFRNAHLLEHGPVFYTPVLTPVTQRFAPAPGWLVIIFAACVNVAAQLGDLVESALKRGAGMKDSGTLLPGHGGVLDRIDALLFALPVGLLFYAFGLSKYFDVRTLP